MPGRRQSPHHPLPTTTSPDAASVGSGPRCPRPREPARLKMADMYSDPPLLVCPLAPGQSPGSGFPRTIATPPAKQRIAAAASKAALKCPGSTLPRAAPSPAANARGADRKPPDPWARTASPDSGHTKSARSRGARPGAGFQPPSPSHRAAAPRRSRCLPPPRGQRTGPFPKPASPRQGAALACAPRPRLRIPHSAFRIPSERPVIQQQHHERPCHQHRLAHQAQGEEEQGNEIEDVKGGKVIGESVPRDLGPRTTDHWTFDL